MKSFTLRELAVLAKCDAKHLPAYTKAFNLARCMKAGDDSHYYYDELPSQFEDISKEFVGSDKFIRIDDFKRFWEVKAEIESRLSLCKPIEVYRQALRFLIGLTWNNTIQIYEWTDICSKFAEHCDKECMLQDYQTSADVYDYADDCSWEFNEEGERL